MSLSPWTVEIIDSNDRLIDQVQLPYQPKPGQVLIYNGARFVCGGGPDSFYGPLQFAVEREAVSA